VECEKSLLHCPHKCSFVSKHYFFVWKNAFINALNLNWNEYLKPTIYKYIDAKTVENTFAMHSFPPLQDSEYLKNQLALFLR
jgi:hypothetical protein